MARSSPRNYPYKGQLYGTSPYGQYSPEEWEDIERRKRLGLVGLSKQDWRNQVSLNRAAIAGQTSQPSVESPILVAQRQAEQVANRAALNEWGQTATDRMALQRDDRALQQQESAATQAINAQKIAQAGAYRGELAKRLAADRAAKSQNGTGDFMRIGGAIVRAPIRALERAASKAGTDYETSGGGFGGALYAGSEAIRGALKPITRGAQLWKQGVTGNYGGTPQQEAVKYGGSHTDRLEEAPVRTPASDYAARNPSLVGGKPLTSKLGRELAPGEFYGYSEGYPQNRAVYGRITPGSAGSRQDILQSPIAGTPAPGGGFYTGGKASAGGRGTASVSGLTGTSPAMNKARMYDEYQQMLERRYPARQRAEFEAARARPQEMQLQREAMASQERIARGEQEAATGLKREEIAGRVAAAGMNRGTPGTIGDKERGQLYAQAMSQASKEAEYNPMTPEQIDKRAGDIFNASLSAATGAQAGAAGQAQSGGVPVTEQNKGADVDQNGKIDVNEDAYFKLKGILASPEFKTMPPDKQQRYKEKASIIASYLDIKRKMAALGMNA